MTVQLKHSKITEIPNTEPAATPALWNTRYNEIDANFKCLAEFQPVGTSATPAAEANKAVEIEGFVLAENAFVLVKFENANTAEAPTLDVSGTGAKAIVFNGTPVDHAYLEANKYYQFVYDGTNWVLTGDVDVRHLYLPLTGGTLTGDLTIADTANLIVNGTTTLSSLDVVGEATFAEKTTVNGEFKAADTATFESVALHQDAIRSSKADAIQTYIDVSKGTAPAEELQSTIGVYDKDGFDNAQNRLATVAYSVDAAKNATLSFLVNKYEASGEETPCGLYAAWENGQSPVIALTHHPVDESDDFSVPTTNWANRRAYELNDFRLPSTAYELGEKVGCAYQAELFLECTQAGTTSAENLDTRSVSYGQVIMDGTCQWTVRAHVKSIGGLVPDENGNVVLLNNIRWEIADSKIDRDTEKPTYGLEEIDFNN